MKYVAILLLLLFSLELRSEDLGAWTLKHGGNGSYRFAEQYARTTDCKVQRVDFTYSKAKRWEFTITTRYIADSVTLYIEGEAHEFTGGGGLHKLSWAVEDALIRRVRDTTQPILIKESYESNKSYFAVMSTDGLQAALEWVGSLP